MATFIRFLGNVDEEKEKKFKLLNKKRKIIKFILNIIKYIFLFVAFIYLIKVMLCLDDLICETLKNYKFVFNKNYFDILNNLLGIQATLATLVVAFVSIFSGFIKDKIYGINITNFIFNVGKFKINIYKLSVFLFGLIVLYFCFLIKMAYFMCVIMFLLTIICIIYIMFKIFDLMCNFGKIEEQVNTFITTELKNAFHKLNYKETDETNLEYILEENFKLKKLYNDASNLLIDLHTDTIEKINVKDFNNYQKNLKLFRTLVYDLKINDMNILKRNLFMTLIERFYNIIYILVNNEKFNLAIEMLMCLSFKVDSAIQDKKTSIRSKKDYLYFFDISDCIISLLVKIQKMYSYNYELIYSIEKLIYDQQNRYVFYVESYTNTKEYDREKIIDEAETLFKSFVNSIKFNKYFSEKDKLRTITEFKEKIHQKNYLDYQSAVFRRTLSNKKENNFKDINTEIKIIKEQILEKLDNILN